MPSGIKIVGLKEAIGNIEKRSLAVQKAVDTQLTLGALKIAKEAKRRAPSYEGKLIQAIVADTNTPNYKEVVCNIFYAPYIEFGTGRKVQIPAGLEAIAAQFKNQPKRGGFDLMVESIALWLRKVGRNPKDARFVAIMILKNGIKAQPYFFPAYDAEKQNIINDVKKAAGG